MLYHMMISEVKLQLPKAMFLALTIKYCGFFLPKKEINNVLEIKLLSLIGHKTITSKRGRWTVLWNFFYSFSHTTLPERQDHDLSPWTLANTFVFQIFFFLKRDLQFFPENITEVKAYFGGRFMKCNIDLFWWCTGTRSLLPPEPMV